jgi:SAM-dependent methyltransferase
MPVSLLTGLRSGLLKRPLDYARQQFPSFYWHARNNFALLQSYWDELSGFRQDPYDDTFWDLHDGGEWESFAQVVLNRFAPRSVLDVGCGQGTMLKAFKHADPNLRIVGLERSGRALARATARGIPVCPLDLVKLTRNELARLRSRLGPFDVVLCLEVAEHIPAWHAGKLLNLLATFDVLIFSAAQPNQGGLRHVNERPAAYWFKKFKARGLRLGDNDHAFRTEVGKLDLPWWYRTNIHVFTRSGYPRS